MTLEEKLVLLEGAEDPEGKAEGDWVIPDGARRLRFGASSRDLRTSVEIPRGRGG